MTHQYSLPKIAFILFPVLGLFLVNSSVVTSQEAAAEIKENAEVANKKTAIKEKKTKKKGQKKEGKKKETVELPEDAPNVLTIGGAIDVQYSRHVANSASGKWRFRGAPSTKSKRNRTSKALLDSLDKDLGKVEWDVIHFSSGMKDTAYQPLEEGGKREDGKPVISIEEYTENLDAIVVRLKATGAKIIFATLTPVPEAKDLTKGDYRTPADVVNYNNAALEVMKKHNVIVNDLYTHILPHQKELQKTYPYFKPEGNKMLGEQVTKCIADALAGKEDKVQPNEEEAAEKKAE